MNHFNLQQIAFAAGEEMRGSASIADRKEPVVCPRPRRVSLLSNSQGRPFRWHTSHAEVCDVKAGSELLDIILMKEGYGAEPSTPQVASSPPGFFCGSPQSRAANPLTQDVRFGDERLTHLSMLPIPPSPSTSGLASPSSSARKGGCVRMKVGFKPAAVRVEGFDCLNRDRQNSSIPAVA